MAGIFDTPIADVILQGTQVLTAALQTKARLQLEREDLELRRKNQEGLAAMREERLRLQEEMLELRRQKQEAEAAGGTGADAGKQLQEVKLADAQIENAARSEMDQGIPQGSPLRSFINLGEEDLRRELTQTEEQIAMTLRDFMAVNQQKSAEDRGDPGPVTALRAHLGHLTEYRDLFLTSKRKFTSLHPKAALLRGNLPTEPTATTPTPTTPTAGAAGAPSPSGPLTRAPAVPLPLVAEPPAADQEVRVLRMVETARKSGIQDRSFYNAAALHLRQLNASGNQAAKTAFVGKLREKGATDIDLARIQSLTL